MTKDAAPRRISVTEALDLRLLPDEGLSFEEILETSWIEAQLATQSDTEETAVHARSPGRADVRVEPLGPVVTRPPIRVRGHLDAPVTMTCVRCLAPVADDLVAELDLTLLPDDHPVDDAGEDAGDEGVLDEGSYSGNTIDLPDLVREALLLELSMNPTCADEDACTERTAALLRRANEEAEGVVIDDRWAALRELRAKVEGEEDEG